MMMEAVVSLGVGALVIARAINILKQKLGIQPPAQQAHVMPGSNLG